MSDKTVLKNVSEIYKISEGIVKRSESLLTKFKTKIRSLKEKSKGIIKSMTHDVEVLLKEKEYSNRQLDELESEKSRLDVLSKEEEIDLDKFKHENFQLKNQVKNLCVEIDNKDKNISKLETNITVIEQRVRREKEVRKEKEVVYKRNADILRKALRLDIIPSKGNITKIIFYREYDGKKERLISEDSNVRFMLMDVARKNEQVVDLNFKNISLHEANMKYKKSENFYEFLKTMRKFE